MQHDIRRMVTPGVETRVHVVELPRKEREWDVELRIVRGEDSSEVLPGHAPDRHIFDDQKPVVDRRERMKDRCSIGQEREDEKPCEYEGGRGDPLQLHERSIAVAPRELILAYH